MDRPLSKLNLSVFITPNAANTRLIDINKRFVFLTIKSIPNLANARDHVIQVVAALLVLILGVSCFAQSSDKISAGDVRALIDSETALTAADYADYIRCLANISLSQPAITVVEKKSQCKERARETGLIVSRKAEPPASVDLGTVEQRAKWQSEKLDRRSPGGKGQ